MDVVMNTFASHRRLHRMGILNGSTFGSCALELGSLLVQLCLDSFVVAVIMSGVLHLLHLMVMLLRQNLLVLDGLNSGVVVMLMSLTVDGFRHGFVSVSIARLRNDCGGNLLVNVGLLLAVMAAVRELAL